MNPNYDTEKLLALLHNLKPFAQHGYISYDNLLQLEAQLKSFYDIITPAKEYINNINRTTLESLYIIDHLYLFHDDATLGSLALVSKNINAILINKYGIDKVDFYRIMHYINLTYDERYIKIKHVRINIKIIMKRQLRLLIGQKLYFKKHREIFFVSDLKYISELYNNNVQCPIIFIPNTICILCKKIKKVGDTHDDCYINFQKDNFNEDVHTICFNYISEESVEDGLHRKFEQKGMIMYTMCDSFDRHFYTCKYMYPELSHQAKKAFPAPLVKKLDIKTYGEGDCYYYKTTLNGILMKKKYSIQRNADIQTFTQKYILPKIIQKKCKGQYKIDPDCINRKFSEFTPCKKCKYPRIMHNIDCIISTH